jgi:hypothetical protein
MTKKKKKTKGNISEHEYNIKNPIFVAITITAVHVLNKMPLKCSSTLDQWIFI